MSDNINENHIKRIAELEKALRDARHPHNTFTCLSQAGDECNCGAAERNAAIDKVLGRRDSAVT